MKLEKIILGYLQTNCYLVKNEETKEVVIVDPAMCPEDLITKIAAEGYTPKAILLTHGHFDHVMGIDRLIKDFPMPVYLHEEEKEVLEQEALNLSSQFHMHYSYDQAIKVKDGQILYLAGIAFQVIHTPGHTKGSCCYYIKDEDVLLSGDTLFYHSVGRSDFPTGNANTLVKSIREKLLCLPEDTKVYPGHDISTSIGDEKRNNPCI